MSAAFSHFGPGTKAFSSILFTTEATDLTFNSITEEAEESNLNLIPNVTNNILGQYRVTREILGILLGG